MSLKPTMIAVRRRGVNRARLGGAGLAAWSLLSSPVLCSVAWSADAPAAAPVAPAAPTVPTAPVVAPVAPAPLAGLSFLIVALDDAELARAAAKIGAAPANPATPSPAAPAPATGVPAPAPIT